LGFLYYQRVNLTAAVASFCAIVLLMTALTAQAASPAEAVVRGAINSMKALPATDGHPEARRRLLDSIDNSLALDLLARQALGPQWDKLSVAERGRFQALFTRSLEILAFPRAAAALSLFKVNYLNAETKPSAEVVRTTLGDASGGTVPLDFMVARRGTRWQITDVIMDGESLAKVVSGQIQNAVQTEGYQKLIEELQKQVTLAEAGARGE
jgi:phospholipid transport system substrate-binding protein